MTDGIDHCNIYSKGATQLGRDLSNFSSHQILTIDGTFSSIEGYWYWLGCRHPERDCLKTLSGWAAKKVGRDLRGPDWVHTPDFRLRIVAAMASKLIMYPSLAQSLKDSTLPFRHYYLYGTKVVEPSEGKWIVDTWDHLRNVIRS